MRTRCLSDRIAEKTLESRFAGIAESQPELLARHCTEAGQIEKAAGLWGKAGQRSLERSAARATDLLFCAGVLEEDGPANPLRVPQIPAALQSLNSPSQVPV